MTLQPSTISSETKPRTLLFVTVFSVLFMVIASFTITNMMAPYIVGSLGGSNDISTYTISFFGIGNALGVPLGRVLATRIGVRGLLVGCMLLFAAFTCACGLATTYPEFLAFRFFQGFVAGPFYALVMIVFARFAPKEKNETFTAITLTLFSVVPVLAACWGGWIAYDYLWRRPFFVNVPLLLIIAAILWHQLKDADFQLKEEVFDPLGYTFFFIGLFCISFFVITGQQLDWFRSPLLVALFAIGVVCLLFFILWDLYHPYPTLNLRLLHRGVFSFTLVNVAALFSAYYGMIILLAQWLTLDANYTPIWIGILLGSMVLSSFFPTLLVKRRWFGEVDCRVPLAIAIIFFAISCFHTTIFDVEIDFGRIAASRIIAGIGLAFFLPPLARLSLFNFSAEKSVSVMNIFHVVRATCSGLGVAFYTTIWQRRKVFFHDRMGSQLTPLSPETQDFFVRAKEFDLHGLAAKEELNYFLERRSTSLALDDVFYLMAWIMVGLLVLLGFSLLYKRKYFSPNR